MKITTSFHVSFSISDMERQEASQHCDLGTEGKGQRETNENKGQVIKLIRFIMRDEGEEPK